MRHDDYQTAIAEERAEQLAIIDNAITEWAATVMNCARDAQRYVEAIANIETGEVWRNDIDGDFAKKWRRACAAGELAGQVLAELQKRRLLLAAAIGDAL